MKDMPIDRKIFLGSLIVLAACGVIVMLLNTKPDDKYMDNVLTKGLWKFETKEGKLARLNEKIWAWRKLIFAGIMIVCLVTSLTVKLTTPLNTLIASAVLFIAWMVFLFYYWYFVVVAEEKEEEKSSQSQKTPASTKDKIVKHSWSERIKINKEDNRLPVTIVTGYLGSGKTTLVKNILSNTVGMKVLVIENEIGTEGVDHELLMQQTAKEEIILMNNGCVCCTVRKDLLSTFKKLFTDEAFSRLDWIVIETTGLADPAPLIQSLYMDRDCQAKMRMDSVLTVVDCKHLPNHLNAAFEIAAKEEEENKKLAETTKKTAIYNSKTKKQRAQRELERQKQQNQGAHGKTSEAILQITFADRILLNKTDLVSSQELQDITKQVLQINPSATIFATNHSKVPIEDILNIRAFDPSKNKALDMFDNNNESNSGTNNDDSNNNDSSNNDSIQPVTAPILFQTDAKGQILRKKININAISGEVTKSGSNSNNDAVNVINNTNTISPISTITCSCIEPLQLNIFNQWISSLLRTKGEDIYRVKGILAMDGYDEQFVVQGVHMIFDGERGPNWEDANNNNIDHGNNNNSNNKDKKKTIRKSKLVFIGKNLDREDIINDFMKCRVLN